MNTKDKTPTTVTRTRKSNAQRTVSFRMAGTLMTLLLLTKAVQAQEADSEIAPKAVHHTIQHGAQKELGRSKGGDSGITYHGGPLLGTAGNAVHVYVIWYGDWTGNTATTIITSFLNSIGGSPYFNINTTYYDNRGKHIKNVVEYLGSITDNYSQGSALGDAQIQMIVASAITSGALPNDEDAVYFVLTSADVTETSGFCTYYCGWHTVATLNGTNIKYAFVGNPDRCPSACEAQTFSSPNNNPGADGMVSVIAHELEEATTDPNLNAWYDSSGAENADKCAWTFGTTYYAPNGSLYNMILDGNYYLIQRNWVNAGGGYCALSY